MPVTEEDIEFSEEEEDAHEELSGPKGLRAQLERVLRENRELSKRIQYFEATEYIRQAGFTDVKPEVLVGVPRDKWEEAARQAQEQARDLKARVAREILSGQGLTGEDLEAAVARLLEGSLTPQEASLKRVAEAQRVAGAPAPQVDLSKITDPMDMIRVGIQNRRH